MGFLNVVIKYTVPWINRLLPLCQYESSSETIHMKMSYACRSIFIQIKAIFR